VPDAILLLGLIQRRAVLRGQRSRFPLIVVFGEYLYALAAYFVTTLDGLIKAARHRHVGA
jgi:hypothetical protein